jgi:hypothetical protein
LNSFDKNLPIYPQAVVSNLDRAYKRQIGEMIEVRFGVLDFWCLDDLSSWVHVEGS